MVFQKQATENGRYIDKQGVRFDVLCCERTESKKYRQIGTKKITIEGMELTMPVIESYLAINDGWDSFANLEEAIQAYGLQERV